MLRTLLSLVFFLPIVLLSAQQVSFERMADFENDTRLTKVFADYQVVRADANVIAAQLAAGSLQVGLPDARTVELAGERLNVLTDDYRVITSGPKGTKTYARSKSALPQSFNGKNANGKFVLTTGEDFIMGRFDMADGEYYIEPARYLLPGAPRDAYLLYRTADVIPNANATCGASSADAERERLDGKVRQEAAAQMAPEGCVVVRLAIASDFTMFQQKGSEPDVISFTTAVIADVRGDYDDPFNVTVEFPIAVQYVATSANDQGGLEAALPTSNDASGILTAFAGWANGGGFGSTPYDEGLLWLDRDIASTDNNGAVSLSTIGLAFTPGLCVEENRFAILESFSTAAASLRNLVSHEVGHTFGLLHSEADANTIMYFQINGSSTFSATSIARLNTFIKTEPCLTGAEPFSNQTGVALPGTPVPAFQLPSTVCNDQVLTLTDESARNPTTRTWTTTAGTIANDNAASTTLTITGTGTQSVTLDVNNNVCTTVPNPTVSLLKPLAIRDEATPPNSCTPNSTNQGTASNFLFGVIEVEFADVNFASGDTRSDGTAYRDLTCAEVGRTDASSIPVEVVVGSNSGSQHQVDVFVDLNNDGTFSINERQLSQDDISASSTVSGSLDLTTAAKDVILRVRVISEFDNNGASASSNEACTTPQFGQVEDFGLIVSSTPLPVEIISFSTTSLSSDVTLDWSVATEIDLSHYRVEHTRDGEKWTELGSVPATGSDDYSFLHSGVARGVHYYRLAAVDFDGSTGYSDIISATLGDEAFAGTVVLAPNPARAGLTFLTVDAADGGVATVYDGLGREILQTQLLAGPTALDLSNQPRGTYWVAIEVGGQRVMRALQR